MKISHIAEKYSIHFAQILFLPVIWLLRFFIVRDNLRRDLDGLDLSKYGKNASFIVYANHQSKLDAFIVCASLPVKTLKYLMPFRFFVFNPYLKGISGKFVNLMGGFPSNYHEKKLFGLDKAHELMDSKQTIVIFPSGMRTREKIAKRGVAVLGARPDTYLIPIHLDWKHSFLCHVHIGRPINGRPDHLPEQLMEHVYDLPEKLLKI
jgi:1-acyl-sn-glycerol-3-phosphate acyltransferase